LSSTLAPTRTSARTSTWLGALAVLAITCVVFLPSLGGEWLDWDDLPLLYENEKWRGFSTEHVGWMFSTFHMGPYQPLSWLSYALDHAWWGMNAYGYHLTNVSLHASTAVLVFFFARRIFVIASSPPSPPSASARDMSDASDERRASSPPPQRTVDIAAACTALAWSIHPLRVESVAWITERRDCLSGFFFVAALLAWLEYTRTEPPSARRWFRLAVAMFALSLLAKGLALVLPFVLLVLDAWPLRRFARPSERSSARASTESSARRTTIESSADRAGSDNSFALRARTLVVEKWPFWILSLAAAVLAVVGQHVAGAIVKTEQHGLVARFSQVFYGLAFYARKTLWPSDLMVLDPIPVPLPSGDARFVASEIAVVLVVALLFATRRRAPAAASAFASYALIAAPVLGFVQTGSQLVAARYSYLACLPLTLLAGGIVFEALRRTNARSDSMRSRSMPWIGTAFVLAACACLVPLGVATASTCRVWHDTFSLWKHDLAIDPNDNAARRNLIVAYLDRGRASRDPAERRASFESALEQCRLGRERGPDAAYFSNAAKVHDLMANDDAANGRRELELALEEARSGIAIVEHSNQRLPEIYESAGVVLCKLERPAEAVPYFEKLVAQDPTSAVRQGMLADALMQCGRTREALAPLEAARRIAPESPAIWLSLGDARSALGDRDAAIDAYRRVIDLERNRLGARAEGDEDYAQAARALAELRAAR
jgi:tetratricopeptide (TPR) repeat protein